METLRKKTYPQKACFCMLCVLFCFAKKAPQFILYKGINSNVFSKVP